jgi:prolipoprotein diacylglyceryltransferase
MHPVLFSLGDTPISAYGFLIAVALILGWVLSLKFARDDKLPADLLGTNYVVSVAAGLLGGRAMWLTQNRDGTVAEWIGELIVLEAGGLSGFGGVLVGLIVTGLLCQNKKIPPGHGSTASRRRSCSAWCSSAWPRSWRVPTSGTTQTPTSSCPCGFRPVHRCTRSSGAI